MKRNKGSQHNKGSHQTKAKRARIDFWKRFGVWVFIVFFALSVAGGLLIVTSHLGSQ